MNIKHPQELHLPDLLPACASGSPTWTNVHTVPEYGRRPWGAARGKRRGETNNPPRGRLGPAQNRLSRALLCLRETCREKHHTHCRRLITIIVLCGICLTRRSASKISLLLPCCSAPLWSTVCARARTPTTACQFRALECYLARPFRVAVVGRPRSPLSSETEAVGPSKVRPDPTSPRCSESETARKVLMKLRVGGRTR